MKIKHTKPVYITPTTHAKLTKLKDTRGINISFAVELAIANWMKKYHPDAEQ